MALRRLRRVLQSQYGVTLESSPTLVGRVLRKIDRRARDFRARGETPPDTKTPTVVAQISADPVWNIRAIDLLHKLGRLTTPKPLNVNMAQLSASWATRRYFWAIADEFGGRQPFRLSTDARQMDFHQKTLLSDEFGIAMAGLLLEQRFDAPAFVDVSFALDDHATYQGIQQIADAQPDYLMWGEIPTSPYYVVECKGSQSNKNTSMDQLRRGLEQVRSLRFAAGVRPVVTLVIATCMEEERTTVYVLDPPPDDEHSDEKSKPEHISERKGEREWTVKDFAAFENRTRIAKDSELLSWAGQFSLASERIAKATVAEHPIRLPDLPLENRTTGVATYKGFSWPLFPELNSRSLKLFTGVEEELLARAVEGSPNTADAALNIQRQVGRARGTQQSPFVSLSENGTCMIIEGVE